MKQLIRLIFAALVLSMLPVAELSAQANRVKPPTRNNQPAKPKPPKKKPTETQPTKPSKRNYVNYCPDGNHPHMVDLGLPSGTKWACCNVGASTPEDYGNYYAWGETKPKSTYSWDTYPYYNSEENVVYLPGDFAGTQYDAATVNWGSPWRTPSKEQIKELVNNCTFTWITQNGVKGGKITGKNGNSIFLPAAGSRVEGKLWRRGRCGSYWSSAIGELYRCAIELFFENSSISDSNSNFDSGNPVRPVR